MKLKKAELKAQVLEALNLQTSKQVASWAKQNNLAVDTLSPKGTESVNGSPKSSQAVQEKIRF